jgi:hypothetical protein
MGGRQGALNWEVKDLYSSGKGVSRTFLIILLRETECNGFAIGQRLVANRSDRFAFSMFIA